jgi:hypothetical protein
MNHDLQGRIIMLKHVKPLALMTAASIAVTGFGLAPAAAAASRATAPHATQAQDAPITEFSSRARHRAYRNYGYHRNNAAALGTFLAIAGSVAAVAAASQYRHHHHGYYRAPYGYYGGPYGGGPYGYYGGRSYYGW